MADTDAGRELDADVLVVGYGPVGQMLTILLAQHGHSVRAVDKFPAAYPRPRAVHFDDEIMRVFAAAGVAEQVQAISEPSQEYDWRNADGRMLIHFDWGAAGPNGWPNSNMFGQPALEQVLAERAATFPAVTVDRGRRAVGVDDLGDHVAVTVEDADGARTTLTARYVIGCDGANSFVREQMATRVTDLGFYYDWLILDVVPHERREWRPMNLQMCDPARPTTVVSGGPGRRRWEFMRLPHETIEELNTEATAWRLLEPWHYTPDNADLERHTVYTFQARWAEQWRIGRVLLAGDAAHLMPPFAGQGMCSGIRDAANLAWKLHLVLADGPGGGPGGAVSPDLLDTYTSERSEHVQHAIHMSVELGNVICLSDPERAAARDAQLFQAGGRPELALPPLPPPVLGPGLLHADTLGALIGAAGQNVPQGVVRGASGQGRFDEVVGTGFAVVVDGAVPDLPGDLVERLRRLGAHLVHLADAPGEAGPWQQIVDVDGVLGGWLAGVGGGAFVMRPDFYLYGAVGDPADLPGLLEELLDKLYQGAQVAVAAG